MLRLPLYRYNSPSILQLHSFFERRASTEHKTNTERSKVHKKATRTLTGAAMLLLLRRTLSNAMFCAFEKFRERTAVEKRRWMQSVWPEHKQKLFLTDKRVLRVC